jgi:hypothetical protein
LIPFVFLSFTTIGLIHSNYTIGSMIHALQGKDPLVEVFADAPIKISQKFVYREGERAEVLADIFTSVLL